MYKLIAKESYGKPTINGNGAGSGITNPILFVDNPTFEYNSVSYGYYDVHTIENVFNNWNDVPGIDYIFMRDRILELITNKALDKCIATVNEPPQSPKVGELYFIDDNPLGEFKNKTGYIAKRIDGAWEFNDPDIIGYQDLTDSEKEIAAKLNIGSLDDEEVLFNKNLIEQWNKEYHNLSTKARLYRILKAETLINRELPATKNIVMLSLTSLVIDLPNIGNVCIDFHKSYKDFGIIGTQFDYHSIKNPQPATGIMDYFYGTSLFTGRGLVDMPWEGRNYTKQEIANNIKAILVDGVY